MPFCTSSCRCRISILSVIPGMLRRSSLVRMGPSDSLHRIVPFQRPSITESMASMGHWGISFFETAILHFLPLSAKAVLTSLSVQTSESVYRRPRLNVQEGSNDLPGHSDDSLHRPAHRYRVRRICFHKPDP